MEDLYCDEVLTQTEETSFSPDLGYYGSEDVNPPHHQKSSEYITTMPNFRKAHIDTILLEDSLVFRNMLTTEECYVSDNNYFENVQKEIKPHMRKHVTDWMLEVQEVYCVWNDNQFNLFLLGLSRIVAWQLKMRNIKCHECHCSRHVFAYHQETK